MVGLSRLLAMGAFLLSRGQVITVEVPGHPRHPPSVQVDSVFLWLIIVDPICLQVGLKIGKFMHKKRSVERNKVVAV